MFILRSIGIARKIERFSSAEIVGNPCVARGGVRIVAHGTGSIVHSLVFAKNAPSGVPERLFLLKMPRRNFPQPCFWYELSLKKLEGINSTAACLSLIVLRK